METQASKKETSLVNEQKPLWKQMPSKKRVNFVIRFKNQTKTWEYHSHIGLIAVVCEIECCPKNRTSSCDP